MSTCVALTAEGTLQPTGQPVTECSGYVLVSAAENAQTQILIDIFKWPTPEVATSYLTGALTLVLVLNAVGYCVGAVVKMLSTERA
ncbi:hypothetical protein JWH11_00995 [Xanthomonas melonis]|jgi:hypothetical protein|uniref:Uncharacterized protein n=1 Tax=Xanthomonas melonis TaxID=56456 RepID=A0ABS8NPY3_9XANT|nr:hypothetical protein [Xanthomonas melonis]MCD0244520.1 hypothetical protein [Xanthomonas melonis]MCD0256766.1 hypothetical protein [Xanthomonas melonis]MCD0265038.1 hypothetical protein [Xanthomonas melonis]